MKLFNSYSQQKEEFIPIDGKKVKMYVCGPTVYDYAHLGHARCYITWDVLYRYLKYRNYDVTYCRNVTDVDDKILKKAEAENKTPEEVSTHWYKVFAQSMKNLNTLPPDVEPFATKTLGEMISMVKTLIEKGFAYETDGDVYFRVKKFKDYGNLSKQPLDDLEAGARVDENDKKENPMDFALWKRDEKFGYKSPWGVGRPGWHIECSAMSRKFLGQSIDIHAGGADLIFPHHENEIAQSECANGCKYVKYWLHNGFVTINKEKMSKSLGNFLTIDKLLENYDANTIRFFILTNHYRMPVEFSDEALSSAQAGVKRLCNIVGGYKFNPSEEILEEETQFIDAMNDDMNTSKALAVLFDLASKFNKTQDEKYLNLLAKLSEVLGFNFSKKELSLEELKTKILPVYSEIVSETVEKSFDEMMEELLAVRKKAREDKNWDLADKMRNSFDKAGFLIKDGKEGSSWELK